MLYNQVWFEKESLIGDEFALHANICILGSGFLATDRMSFLQSPGTQGQNIAIYIIYIYYISLV